MAIDFNYAPTGTAGANDWFEVTGVQLEVGSVATPFKTYGGTIQGELAACQRYYLLLAEGNAKTLGMGAYNGSTQFEGTVAFPVTMRIAPTLIATSGTNFYATRGGDGFDSLVIWQPSQNATNIYNGSQVSGTSGFASVFATNNSAASVAFNAEL
jgi:hypothetical protein